MTQDVAFLQDDSQTIIITISITAAKTQTMILRWSFDEKNKMKKQLYVKKVSI